MIPISESSHAGSSGRGLVRRASLILSTGFSVPLRLIPISTRQHRGRMPLRGLPQHQADHPQQRPHQGSPGVELESTNHGVPTIIREVALGRPCFDKTLRQPIERSGESVHPNHKPMLRFPMRNGFDITVTAGGHHSNPCPGDLRRLMLERCAANPGQGPPAGERRPVFGDQDVADNVCQRRRGPAPEFNGDRWGMFRGRRCRVR